MARVWGAAAPARLALLLLLAAACSQETRAAPWRAPDDGAPSADGWVKTAVVPRGKPGGPLGELPKRSPVPEPGLDARGAGGAESTPASQPSSRTEAPAARMGPGGWKVAWEDGKYSKRLSNLLMKIMAKAAREADGEPVHRAAFQHGSRLTPPVQLGGTEATHTTGAPGAWLQLMEPSTKSAATACPHLDILLSSRGLADGDDAHDLTTACPPAARHHRGGPCQPPSCPGHQHHPPTPPPSFGGREQSLRASAWGQPRPRGSLRAWQPPAPPLPSLSLPASIRRWKRAQQGAALGATNRQTSAAWGKPTAPAAPRPPQASAPPSHSPPPSFGRWEQPPKLSVWGHHPAASLGASSIAQPGSTPSPAAPSPPQSTTSALPLLSTISQEVGAPPACGFGGIA
ncbi:nascent polypeptide-associated complex subunit alpha, muscle-specific form-like isoform X2 [Lagopus muta]|uniref:nascent polypeptide-associated complex subunit alpha, muscle-specific form-like isoform X2 n=1 Tax=Lagopus muta TaxID=64668 RepID=UPI0020A1811D|nr:nascent polypeptide-associated complex subunit alpha, muscle-specific form-like isoform X2 [Lagopus muta]XP_048813935.1 nascent polypeptide-associated complex subunit alpha, muscle-specific form-like isoform X2 [Lagopus muta]